MHQLLNIELYKFLLIFLRFGSAMMLMPGFSAGYVGTKFRLCIALSISFILIPVIGDKLPPISTSFGNNLSMFLIEITYGVFIGIFMQILMFAIDLGGNLAGQAIGFSNAQMFDPAFKQQSIIINTFLSLTALTIIFITNLHHLMISAAIESYAILPAGSNIITEDIANTISQTINQSFIIGFKLGSPFVAFSIIFYVGMGLLSRLMPQLNIFFLSMPLQIYLGIGLVFITLSTIIIWFCQYYENALQMFLK